MVCTQHAHLRIVVKPAEDELEGYLTHKKQRPPRTLQKDYTEGSMVVLGGGAVSYERGTPARIFEVIYMGPSPENLSRSEHM